MNKAKNSEEPKAAAPAYQNRVTRVGYLGRQPEQIEGRAVLSLATKTSWKPKGSDEWQSRTELCRYEVEATSPEEAEQVFDDCDAECTSSETIDAFESVDEITPVPDSTRRPEP